MIQGDKLGPYIKRISLKEDGGGGKDEKKI